MNFGTTTKHKIMRVAISMAQEAIESGNSPFGAVIADLNGNIIATTSNTIKRTATQPLTQK